MDKILEGLDTSDKIKALMAVKGITRITMGYLLDVTPETISNRLVDNRWKSTDLKKLAALFNVDVRDLI